MVLSPLQILRILLILANGSARTLSCLPRPQCGSPLPPGFGLFRHRPVLVDLIGIRSVTTFDFCQIRHVPTRSLNVEVQLPIQPNSSNRDSSTPPGRHTTTFSIFPPFLTSKLRHIFATAVNISPSVQFGTSAGPRLPLGRRWDWHREAQGAFLVGRSFMYSIKPIYSFFFMQS